MASTSVFTSQPVTAATQGVAYTYQITAVDPAGGGVTLSLTTGPTAAVLTGSSVSWTPTAAQSRVSNSFAVEATTVSGGTASQSWMVTPGGTITVNWMNTYWTPTGPVQVPEPASGSLNISAFVTNPDDSITVEKSSAASAGVFTIANVPGGYYWLQIRGGVYWTSTGTFDAGRDIAGAQEPTAGTPQITTFDLNISGLEAVPQETSLTFAFPMTPTPGAGLGVLPNSITVTGQVGFSSAIDWSKVNTGFLPQYPLVPVGSLNNLVLGNALTASLSLTSGEVRI